MVTLTNLLEAVKAPLFRQTSPKPTEVSLLCRTFKEFQIARTLNQFNVNVAHKPVMTVGFILRKPKDKFSKDLSSGVIYKINCKDCDKVYIGQTSRALRSRTREHKRAIFTGDKNSSLAQHFIKNSHEFDLDDVKIIDRCSQWSKRLFLEAWHSIREPNAIIEHKYIPDIYKALGNPK